MITHTTPTATEKKVTLSIQDDEVKCSHLQDLVTGAVDGDRLRGVYQVANVSLYLQPRSDAIIRRVFSRGEIDNERAVVKRALLQAASNLTPERLKRMGSPGRLAVQRLQQRAARTGRHDIKVAHVSSDITFLASSGRKRSFLHSPAKPVKSSSLRKTGAAGLAATHIDHRIRLLHFCVSAGTLESLPVLLRQPQDQNQDMKTISCCIALFTAAVASFIAEEKNVQGVDKGKLFDCLRASMKGDLPYVFIDRWQLARKNGLINERSFEWVAAVDWLVDGLRPDKQLPSKCARKPRSPRSPACSSPSRLPLQPEFSPLPVRQPSHAMSFQPGRQAVTFRIPVLPDSPSRFVLMANNGRNVQAPKVNRATKLQISRSAANRHEKPMPPVARSTEKAEKAARIAGKRNVPAIARRQQTLEDMLYLVSIGKSVSQTIITADAMPMPIKEEENASI
ncbi:hypothetical protein KTQ42_06735|uniref:hypothetical protein n=1 Tax=Noviherbaspirillum sp. L7-7A TaxID=2850560 RepID=UPI001C2BB115|nr:hypothetical protein [Noviherbaspirillum sp. L7-7A]MBV0879001.1 hypothetical protein [Noviherbaspirillum sp. L7-7A]